MNATVTPRPIMVPTFMRMKKDYMGNDQLLPGYNIQLVSVMNISQYST